MDRLLSIGIHVFSLFLCIHILVKIDYRFRMANSFENSTLRLRNRFINIIFAILFYYCDFAMVITTRRVLPARTRKIFLKIK